MSSLLIVLDDGADDTYTVDSLDNVATDLAAANLDGGHLILMAPDRSIAVDSSIAFAKGGEETKPKKPSKKEGSKK